MIEEKLTVVNPLGLHARAAAQLVRLASAFESRMTIARSATEFADAKSILSILAMAAGKGTELTLMVEGPDERAAADAVRDLFAEGFGEI
ncbi:MAG: HPr family phosphocarrier protein [Acidobacteria bacterium]|nr:HPr family phosphocarrier protein [Acidobacteriota bacterium]